MLDFRFGVVGALAFATAAMLMPSSARAATCSAVAGGGFVSAVTTPTDATCIAFGGGNINGDASDPIVVMGYTLLDAVDLSGWVNNGHLSVTGNSSGFGNFTVTAFASFQNYVVAFKDGNLEDGLKWGAFSLPAGDFVAGVLSGTWALFGDNGAFHGLSHANLYGQSCGPPGSGCAPPETTPGPGAIFLMGSVLAGGIGGMQLMRRRRKFAA
jgi:hypothetical protein